MMDARTLDRFRKVCGLLSSEHVGERAAAALRATEMLRSAGLSWSEVTFGALGATMADGYDTASAMAAIYKMRLDSEQARTTRMAEEITRLKREVSRLKGMWPKVSA